MYSMRITLKPLTENKPEVGFYINNLFLIMTKKKLPKYDLLLHSLKFYNPKSCYIWLHPKIGYLCLGVLHYLMFTDWT